MLGCQSKFAGCCGFALFGRRGILSGSLSCCIFCTFFRCGVFGRSSLRFSLCRSILCSGGLNLRILHSAFCHGIFSHSRILFVFIHWRCISFLLIGWIIILRSIVLLNCLILIEPVADLSGNIFNRKISSNAAACHSGLNTWISRRQDAATVKFKRPHRNVAVLICGATSHIGQLNTVIFRPITGENINRIAEFCPNQTINTQILPFNASAVILNDPAGITRFWNNTIGLTSINVPHIFVCDPQFMFMPFEILVFLVKFIYNVAQDRRITDRRYCFVDRVFCKTCFIEVCSSVHYINADINEAKIRRFILALLNKRNRISLIHSAFTSSSAK